MFEEYAGFIHQNFPTVHIQGDNYPPPRPRQMLASFISLLKLAIMAIILLGERLNIWQSLNMEPPQIYIWATQNKVVWQQHNYVICFQYTVICNF